MWLGLVEGCDVMMVMTRRLDKKYKVEVGDACVPHFPCKPELF